MAPAPHHRPTKPSHPPPCSHLRPTLTTPARPPIRPSTHLLDVVVRDVVHAPRPLVPQQYGAGHLGVQPHLHPPAVAGEQPHVAVVLAAEAALVPQGVWVDTDGWVDGWVDADRPGSVVLKVGSNVMSSPVSAAASSEKIIQLPGKTTARRRTTKPNAHKRSPTDARSSRPSRLPAGALPPDMFISAAPPAKTAAPPPAYSSSERRLWGVG
jgi:hypothetical protein